MTGVLILAAFFAFAGLMYARLLPALLAVPAMAIAVAALAGVDLPGIAGIVADGSTALAGVYVTVIFGALLGRVAMETGIAETIVNYAAEFGGDRPIVVCLTLCAAVAVLFTSLTGLGAIIMVGSIVLPIMMTVGVPRKIAATTFLLAFAAGFIFNLAQWTFYAKLFGVERAPLQTFAVVLFVIDVVALVAYTFVHFGRMRDYATWAVAAPQVRRAAPVWALVTPLVPLVLYIGFHASAIVAFALASLYGALAVRPRSAVKVLVSSAIRGLEDVAPAVILMIGIGMLLAATKTPLVAQALRPVVAFVAPHTPLAYVVVFGLASPLALFRGPLNPFGVGIGVYTVLAGLGVLPPVALVAAVMAVVQVQNVCDPTNTQNVWVANYTGVRVDEITRMTLAPQVAVATLACIVVAAFGARLFGAPVFAAVTPFASVAGAAETGGESGLRARFPGLYAPAGAAYTIVVRGAADAVSETAAKTMRDEISRGWKGFAVVESDASPSASDCRVKPYVAVVSVTSSAWSGALGTTTDLGLELLDCAGWGVDQWHEQSQSSGTLERAGIMRLALATLFRLRTWTTERPALAQALFENGLAIVPGESAPTYLYTLYKTDDGYMRAYVRPGGPAYVAGMRTGDIVDKLDGRFWWEYGTYQTQLRAYDGKPHTFALTRAGKDIVVKLGAPLV